MKPIVRGTLESNSFVVFYLRKQRLVAADVINAPRDFMALRKILPLAPKVSGEQLADSQLPISELAS